MGHVDHGKTTLLDAFRHSEEVAGEYGEITQKIGAFTFQTDWSHKEITFIDTPGHEAFQNLRLRGAQVTDIILLVVSAVEGLQPQTLEVLDIAQQYDIPLVIAINKVDRSEADPDQVVIELQEHGIVAEQLGGEVPCVFISAKERQNLQALEKKIVEVAEKKLRLKEDFSSHA